ncbi:MAG TPA: HIT domain-containing protein [Candidatus Saccharimonadales bacterium]|nr:HIT domain-containing protein [Candidatus Saccharimonadales bacterium]
MNTPTEDRKKQELYRDARFTNNYDSIWKNVGKCVFCDLRDKYILREENGIVLTITLFAYIDGHMMIVPRRHIESPKDFMPQEWETIRKFMYLAKKMIKEAHNIKGVQFVQKEGASAQSTVGHIHYHAIPFDAPDLSTWNYRRLANTPLENAAKYKKIAKKVEALATRFDQKYQETLADQAASTYSLDWSDLAFGNKKQVSKLAATFIAAPRQLSTRRLTELVKAYLPKGNLVIGLAKEPYIDGFEGQPQFKTLQAAEIQPLVDRVNKASKKHNIYTLVYFQRELPFILEKIDFKHAIFINGSWHKIFHVRPEYYTLVKRRIPYALISPFSDEQEARAYEAQMQSAQPMPKDSDLSEDRIMQVVARSASLSFAHDFQTGAALVKPSKNGYKLLATSCNQVVPFKTYAMHYGSTREEHFSPPNDLNFYDTIHAETALLLNAAEQKIGLKGTTLFINLLPCPTCARMLSQTAIAEIVYNTDHSDGYAIKLLQKAGKKIRRII